MTNNGQIRNIDIGDFSNLAEVIGKCFINGNNLFIQLKKPKEDTIIVTIKQEYTAFRKEIDKLLKEKEVDKEDAKKILFLVDNSHESIYLDNTYSTNNGAKISKSDQPDLSDSPDLNKKTIIVNVSECLKLHYGRVEVSGNIVGMSERFKMIASVKQECNCGEAVKVFDPPIYKLEDESHCFKCEKRYKRDKESIEYKNALTVYLQD